MDQTLIRAFRLFSVSENFLVVEDTLSLYKTIPQCLITIHLTGKIKDRANSSNVCTHQILLKGEYREYQRHEKEEKAAKAKEAKEVCASMWMIMINIVKERKQKLRQRTG